MQDISLVDETFDINFSENYHISMQSDLHGFSYCILDTRVNKYIILKHFSFENLSVEIALEKLEDFVNAESNITSTCKSATFSICDSSSILVPRLFFDQSNLKTFFEIHHDLKELDELHFAELKEPDAFMVFAIPSRIAGIIKRKIPHIKFLHGNIPFILHNLKNISESEQEVFVNFTLSYLNVLVIKNKKIVLFNSYPYHEATDVVYFILNILEQHGFDANEIRVSVTGTKQKNSKTIHQLKNYIKNIKFEKPSIDHTYSYTFNDIDLHIYQNLINTHDCV